jgi:catechol 2,3-dioxygenase-like lactoylglutathione lyase family enzyme
MQTLGFVLLYTPDVPAKLDFYERAFGCQRAYLSEAKTYGQLAGTPPIAFAAEGFAQDGIGAFTRSRRADAPPAIELGFVVPDVDAAFRHAVEAGCSAVVEPTDKPWGQRVAYVRDDDGVLVEICTAWSV